MQAIDMLMFGFVTGMRKALPAVSIDKALECFCKHYGFEEDVYGLEAAKAQYYRLSKYLYDSQRDTMKD